MPQPYRELLSSRSAHDAMLMNVEPDGDTALTAWPGGWFSIKTADGCVDLNPQTARLMAREILRRLP